MKPAALQLLVFGARRNDLAQLVLRAMLAGTMANLMSASIVSMLLH